MKTGKHRAPAPAKKRGSKAAPLVLAAALVVVALLLILPRSGLLTAPAGTDEPLDRALPGAEESTELPPLDSYDISTQLDGDTLIVNGTGAMPALDRMYTEQELASVKELVLGEGITAFDLDAFAGCKLETITVPAAVTQIAEGAFRDCPGLKEILVEQGNPAYISKDGVLMSADGSLLLCYPGGRAANGYRVQEGVTRIAAYAFSGFRLTETLYLPASLTEIGEEAFSRCYGLSAIKVNSGNPAFTAADGVLYNKDKSVLLRYPSGKNSPRFRLPDSVTEIAAGAFSENYELTEVTLPDGLTRIGRDAFTGCSFLRSLSLPGGLLAVGDRAFLSCSRLQQLTLPERLESLGDQAFAYCYELSSLTLPARLPELGSEVFRRCDSLSSVEVPAGFTVIGDGMFRECASLESVALPDSISAIGEGAFADCHALKTVRYAGTQAQWEALSPDAAAIPEGAELVFAG